MIIDREPISQLKLSGIQADMYTGLVSTSDQSPEERVDFATNIAGELGVRPAAEIISFLHPIDVTQEVTPDDTELAVAGIIAISHASGYLPLKGAVQTSEVWVNAVNRRRPFCPKIFARGDFTRIIRASSNHLAMLANMDPSLVDHTVSRQRIDDFADTLRTSRPVSGRFIRLGRYCGNTILDAISPKEQAFYT